MFSLGVIEQHKFLVWSILLTRNGSKTAIGNSKNSIHLTLSKLIKYVLNAMVAIINIGKTKALTILNALNLAGPNRKK
jgi:hypothetical protein